MMHASRTMQTLAGSFVISALVLLVPATFITRFANGLLPAQPTDPALALAVLAWIFVSKAILQRDDINPHLLHSRTSIRNVPHNAVERSIFGVGFTPKHTEDDLAPRLHRLTAPTILTEADLPPHRAVESRPERTDGDEVPVPVTMVSAKKSTPLMAFDETFEHIVGRGETFWSLAEDYLGDGRLWSVIRDLNVGRDVAPDVVMEIDAEPHIGWSLLVPVRPEIEESEAS